MRLAIVVAFAAVGIAIGAAFALGGGPRNAYEVSSLAADRAGHARHVDARLVNAWGLAASPTGPWWTSNEASSTSTLYSGEGRAQLLTVQVPGGPTGVVWHAGTGFRVAAGRVSDSARFIYACEDGKLRGWAPSVPTGWSTEAVVAVDEGASAAVFRGVAIDGARLYATDFHNARVDVYDSRWQRVRAPGAFADRSIAEWYAPFGIQALGGHIFVTYVWRAPVNGNDAPTGGYVDEYDRSGKLLARVARGGKLNAPWGLALAPHSFGRFGGDLLVGNFGDGRINAYRRNSNGWTYDGTVNDRHGRPVVVNGLWGLAFGTGGLAGSPSTLFFTSGPHVWRGETENSVHGLLGSITPA
jgi:uncharacterized protein (TIGR03118 family)